MQPPIGVIGLGVMGASLALNLERNGFPVVGFDLDPLRTSAFMDGPASEKQISLATSLIDLATALPAPRLILLLVPAGSPVDSVLAALLPGLTQGDIVIDGGNSHFLDTERRFLRLQEQGLHFVGMGISGGEAGALLGPSLMPGGDEQSWQALAPVLRTIAATDETGRPCVAYMGTGGAGHYVKMVHNGIEYAEMQLIAEVYDLLSRGLGLPAPEIGELFAEWSRDEQASYLLETSAGVLATLDPETGGALVDVILDVSEQKGTGKWACQDALTIGAPLSVIGAGVESRFLSTLKEQRSQASRMLPGPQPATTGPLISLLQAAGGALYAGRVLAYVQGFGLLRAASAEYGYDFRYASIAGVWKAGSILRSVLLDEVEAAFLNNPALENLLLTSRWADMLGQHQAALRQLVKTMIERGLPAPALSAALAYYDGYRSDRLPANLIQAQRDFFGAHTYRRVDRPGSFHTRWGSEA